MSEHYKYVDNDKMNWWLCDGSWLLRTDQVNHLDQIISLSYFLPRETNVDPSIFLGDKCWSVNLLQEKGGDQTFAKV